MVMKNKEIRMTIRYIIKREEQHQYLCWFDNPEDAIACVERNIHNGPFIIVVEYIID